MEDSDDADNVVAKNKHSSWEQQRASLLVKFTTTGTLTFTSSFLQPSDSGKIILLISNGCCFALFYEDIKLSGHISFVYAYYVLFW